MITYSIMKTLSLALSGMLLFCGHVWALDFANHVFFKHLIGEWKASGELKGENNNLVTITENWTGRADAEGSFFIEGTRVINGETQPYKWTITCNPATQGFEAVLSGSDASQTIRFEGSVSEVTLTLDLKAITGTGAGTITVQDSFADDSKDTLKSNVTFTGDAGQKTLEGTITHKRVKAP